MTTSLNKTTFRGAVEGDHPTKRPKKVFKNVWYVLVTSLLCFVGLSAALRPSPQTSAQSVGGLQMTLYLDQAAGVQSKAPKFKVELHNAGENDLILNLGIMLANGKRQYPSNVVLTLTDSKGISRRLDMIEPGDVAGTLAPMVLPLPVGATFSFPIDLNKYWPAASKEFDYKLKPGAYSLKAQLTGKGVSQQEDNLDVKGIALTPYWRGTVTSNQIRFEVPSQ